MKKKTISRKSIIVLCHFLSKRLGHQPWVLWRIFGSKEPWGGAWKFPWSTKGCDNEKALLQVDSVSWTLESGEEGSNSIKNVFLSTVIILVNGGWSSHEGGRWLSYAKSWWLQNQTGGGRERWRAKREGVMKNRMVFHSIWATYIFLKFFNN